MKERESIWDDWVTKGRERRREETKEKTTKDIERGDKKRKERRGEQHIK